VTVAHLALVTSLALGALAAPQDPPPVATEVEEVVVVGERLQTTAQTFVRALAAPPPGRKAARWDEPLCVGVIGMRPDLAQLMVDRITAVALELGVPASRPGCRPDVFIVAAADGDAMARDLVQTRPDDFRLGLSGTDLGAAALEVFQSSGRPIRWWHVSLAVNADTGQPIQRLPGQQPFVAPRERTRPADFGAYATIVSPSLIRDETRDVLARVVIALDRASFGQISDYVAMVALAQIDPEAAPEVPSILNLFRDAPAAEPGLSAWDRAYLSALYRTDQMASNPDTNLSTIGRVIARDLAGTEAEAGITTPTAPE
jgi:hypothetical protein